MPDNPTGAKKRGRGRRLGSRALTGGRIKRAGSHVWEKAEGHTPEPGDKYYDYKTSGKFTEVPYPDYSAPRPAKLKLPKK